MLDLSHVLSLYIGVVLGWFLASLCYAAKKNEDIEKDKEDRHSKP